MIENKEITLADRKVFFRRGGEGKPLLMIHGWQGSSADWEESIMNLSRNWLGVAVDLPGFGESSQPREIWGIREFSEWVNLFADKMGWESFVLIGKSFGGRIAIDYAAHDHNRLRGLILVSAAGIEKKSINTLGKIVLAKAGRFLVSRFPLVDEEFLRGVYYNVLGIKREENWKMEVKKRVTNQDLTGILDTIRLPTLVVWGENDEVLPLELGVEMSRAIQDSTLKVIRDGNHDVFKKKTEEFCSVVKKFLHEINY